MCYGRHFIFPFFILDISIKTAAFSVASNIPAESLNFNEHVKIRSWKLVVIEMKVEKFHKISVFNDE